MNSSRRPNRPHDLLDEVELFGIPGGESLQFGFQGPFEGRLVNWQATLFTPTGWAGRFGEAKPSQNIIEVLEGDEGSCILNICLKVTAIDLPTVRKAIMMARQYRRLRRGRHHYG